MIKSVIAKRRFRRRFRPSFYYYKLLRSPYPGSYLRALRYKFEKEIFDILKRDLYFFTEEYR